MTKRAAAGRYARALFDVALEQGDPRRAGADLERFATLLREHAALERVLLNPALPAAAKRSLAEALADRLDLSGAPRRLVALLAEQNGLAWLPDVVERFQARLREHLQELHADITTAVPLAADRVSRLAESLSAATGRRVSMATRVDPAIVGGVVAKIGSTVYDGSVTRHLARIRQRLAEGA